MVTGYGGLLAYVARKMLKSGVWELYYFGNFTHLNIYIARADHGKHEDFRNEMLLKSILPVSKAHFVPWPKSTSTRYTARLTIHMMCLSHRQIA